MCRCKIDNELHKLYKSTKKYSLTMQFSNSDDLRHFLEYSAKNTNEILIAEDIMNMINPMIREIGLDEESIKTFEQYLHFKDGYTIDAQKAFKKLGIVSNNAYSDKILRCLVRANIIDNLKLSEMNTMTPQVGGSANAS